MKIPKKLTISTDGSVAAGIVVASGAACNHRTIPCEPAPVLSATVAGATITIIHEDVAGEPATRQRKHTTCNAFVYEAMRILREHGYELNRLTGGNGRPVSIVAMKGTEVLMIAIIRFQKPVPDAKTLRRMKPELFDQLCASVKPGKYKTMIWVTSPLIGWRYYRVESGGISYDWTFAKMLEE